MSKEDSAGLGVNNFYGPRNTTEGWVGNMKTEGAVEQLVFVITGDNFAGGTTDTVLEGTIPAGAKVLDVYTEITDAFTIGNADNILEIGTAGSVATNGVELSADLDATGLYADVPPATINGTWANQLAADTAVGAIVSGTTAAISAGTAKVVITYVNM
jgi:hypothetical protein